MGVAVRMAVLEALASHLPNGDDPDAPLLANAAPRRPRHRPGRARQRARARRRRRRHRAGARRPAPPEGAARRRLRRSRARAGPRRHARLHGRARSRAPRDAARPRARRRRRAASRRSSACRTPTPSIDDPAIVDFVLRRARDTAVVNMHPAAAITKGLAGREMTEFGLLSEAGAVAFTDGAHGCRERAGDAPRADLRARFRRAAHAAPRGSPTSSATAS